MKRRPKEKWVTRVHGQQHTAHHERCEKCNQGRRGGFGSLRRLRRFEHAAGVLRIESGNRLIEVRSWLRGGGSASVFACSMVKTVSPRVEIAGDQERTRSTRPLTRGAVRGTVVDGSIPRRRSLARLGRSTRVAKVTCGCRCREPIDGDPVERKGGWPGLPSPSTIRVYWRRG
jgi:hypothetical protein